MILSQQVYELTGAVQLNQTSSRYSIFLFGIEPANIISKSACRTFADATNKDKNVIWDGKGIWKSVPQANDSDRSVYWEVRHVDPGSV